MAHPVDEHVGVRLRLLRKARGISQSVLAERLGITFQQIQKYERGTNRVSASKLHEAAQVLGVSIAAFFEGLPGGGGGTSLPMQLDAASEQDVRRLVQGFANVPKDLRRRVLDLAEVMSRP